MARTPEQKTHTLAELGHNQLLLSKVVTLLDKNTSYDNILNFLEAQDFKLSKGTLTNLSKKLKTSRDLGVPLAQLLDKRKKKDFTQLPPEKIVGYTGNEDEDIGRTPVTDKDLEQFSANLPDSLNVSPTQVKTGFYSVDSVLEKIIGLGINTLGTMNYVDMNILMKALDVYSKNHDTESNRGLTLDALKQYTLITEAKLKAFQDVIFTYIPEDKQAEALEALPKIEDEMLKSIEATPEGMDLMKVLKKAGLD